MSAPDIAALIHDWNAPDDAARLTGYEWLARAVELQKFWEQTL